LIFKDLITESPRNGTALVALDRSWTCNIVSIKIDMELYEAASRGDAVTVATALVRDPASLGEAMQRTYDDGHTPLSIAIRNKHIDIARVFVWFLDVSVDTLSLVEAADAAQGEDEGSAEWRQWMEILELVSATYTRAGINPVDRYKSIVDAQVTATKEEIQALQQQVDEANRAYDAKVRDKEQALQAECDRLQRLCKRSS
jgi:hypothetical protein